MDRFKNLFTWQFLVREKRGVDFVDFAVIAAALVLFWLVGSLGRDMAVPFSAEIQPQVSLEAGNIPYYAARSTLRMFIAYGGSLLFTLVVGYIAAHSSRGRLLILPALDVLQSVPVLGFLSATVTGFIALFPGSLLGVEMASIFAIFTGQVWNMTFGFYHSLVTIPEDMKEAAAVFRLNPWQRFTKLELPSSAISLVWNSMMSFGGGWFFVVQSEAISVLNQKITLPGLGSYMGMAVAEGNSKAALLAVGAMVFVILAVDQLLWKPVVAWSQKFRVEQVESTEAPESWALNFYRRSSFFVFVTGELGCVLAGHLDRFFHKVFTSLGRTERRAPQMRAWSRHLATVLFWGVVLLLLYYGFVLAKEIEKGLTLSEIKRIVTLGFFTMGRVFVMVIVATLVWTPIGVWIGFRPKVARYAQPLAQIAASFPVNMTFPFVVGFFVAHHVHINLGSILLIALGTQWYILFNVIAGASSVPSDLKECAKVYGLKGLDLWKRLLIPSIFPYWVTGACTAAGGAWNASIVAEYASWGKTNLVADGLGAFIAQVTEKGDWPAIFCSIVTMSFFVVTINRLLWRNLYNLAERRFRLD